MGNSSNVGERELANFLEHLDTFGCITKIECIVKTRHDVPTHLCDLEHLAELVVVTCDKIEEAQTLEVLSALVGHLDNLLVTLTECLNAKACPALLVINLEGSCHSYLKVSALNGEVEARLLILHEVQCYLRVTLCLEVGDDSLSTEVGIADHTNNLSVLLVHESDLEEALSRIDGNLAYLTLAVKAVQCVLGHASDVHRKIKRANHTSISVRNAVLDVVEGRVHKDTVRTPRTGLDSHGLWYRTLLLELLIADYHSVFAQQCHHRAVFVPYHVANHRYNHFAKHASGLRVKERNAVL
mmetsp:Transcript_2603/g.6058  ORF Transcript_2603/g.6058 Transcript_2603/m.6058 type:complete len:298 (+) Transcript_2603:1497-2390(+)